MEDQELVMFWLAGDHKLAIRKGLTSIILANELRKKGYKDKLIEDFLNDFARDLKNDQKQVLKNSQRLLNAESFFSGTIIYRLFMKTAQLLPCNFAIPFLATSSNCLAESAIAFFSRSLSGTSITFATPEALTTAGVPM